jgi:hypothetical protein
VTAIAERVARGAALLDKQDPGWWQRIDLSTLDLKDVCNCVLGQLGDTSDYFDICKSLDLRPHGTGERGAVALGFNAVPLDEYDPLTAAWRELIESRRAS